MKRLRVQLFAYLFALHALLFVLVFLLLREQPWLFIGLEVLLAASFVLGLRLQRRALEPLGYTQHLRELLQDQDYAARLRSSGGSELDQLVGQFNALLDTLHAERLRIGEQQGFLDRLLEATPSAVIVFDFDGRISLLNPSAQALRHREQLLQQLESLPDGASTMLSDPDGRRYRGQRGHFYDRGFARRFLLLEELTEELQSSERATYEKLVRVLGHEVNNTVAATGSVLESLLYYRRQLAAADGEDFATAIGAVKRRNASLGEFIERFTHVAKLPAPELRPCAVQDVVEDILYLYREPCRSRGIRIGWRHRDQAGPLPMDRQLIEQALQNLVKNAMEAADATQQERGGQAAVELELVREAGGMRLSVIDSGARLAEVPASQLFTPFFSTKKGGQGIGLLLVREVLLRHGFAHRLAPNAAGETSFDIWLPHHPAS
ncbi:sensor histidine kinase [Pseudoduganella violaceinigra]|uniref:sensor histidine kinase n=1 Tax=Pseudoduganella violaceinigra TaxID=246602 RepID=UPI00041F7EF6|nr:ATP-binding protein [Pseudoduganella violaceinigra]